LRRLRLPDSAEERRTTAYTVEWDPRVVRTLTAHQLEMLRLAAEGCPNKQIAEVLGVSVGTVKQTLTHAYLILGVRTRTQAVVLCWRRGWLH
jgi:DNA-binding CsgD family transcriptional regulator